LDDLGITSGGYDNNLTLSDSAKLDAALANNLKGVEALFTASASGVAVGVVTFLERTVGEGGTLVAKQDLLTKQSKDIDVQIAEMERRLESQRQSMIERFMAMETAQAKINQQLQFLMQKFGTGSTAST
jgi:flagellar hook-associated protein 2